MRNCAVDCKGVTMSCIVNLDLIFLILIVLIPIVGIYFLIRNEKVYKFRIHLLEKKDYESYECLPSYEDMVFKYWWQWDFNKFLIKKVENDR